MARLADGDRGAIDLVYRMLWPKLVRYCTSLVGDATEAEDLAQSALLKLFEQAHDYDPSKPAEAWALTIAAWECRTYLRKRLRNERKLAKVERAEAIDASPSLDAEAWKRRALAALEELVAQMPSKDRQALSDSFVMGLSEPVHRKRKHRALSRLRRRWRELYGSD